MAVTLAPRKDEFAEEEVGKELMKHAAIFQRIIDLERAIFNLECLRNRVGGGDRKEPEEPTEPPTPSLAEFLDGTTGQLTQLLERLAVVEKELRGMLF